MHDPHTQAFVIPWRYKTQQFTVGGKPWRYWVPLITIWHKDPEKRGSDDSCGWFTPPFTDTQREIVKSLSGDEARDPWFLSLSAKTNSNPVECESYVRGAFLLVARCMKNRKCLRSKVTLEDATTWASIMIHNPIDNFRSSLAFKSGWHSNSYRDGELNTEKEDEYFREQNAASFFGAIMGYILREQRYWWEHPRWHFWHWELQIHPAQTFKRWAFSKCCKCGKGFKWGYSPMSTSWNSTGPKWLKSEEYVSHADCSDPTGGSISAMLDPSAKV